METGCIVEVASESCSYLHLPLFFQKKNLNCTLGKFCQKFQKTLRLAKFQKNIEIHKEWKGMVLTPTS